MELEKDFVYKEKDNVRMSGFLEKKGKMKLMSQWKKYWFVLEKRLLLYYRSKIEYSNLSPCRGSLNMGLVTTVRPGSSSGPCIIHIITRTQTMQLRAKNRAAQEEWLQALLYSMALPIFPKILKPPTSKLNFLGCTASLENVSLNNNWKHTNLVDEWTLPRKFNYRKRQISGAYYGGSLDTAIWSKKFRPIQPANMSKKKILEKFLGYQKEPDSLSLMMSSQKDLHHGNYNESHIKYLGKNEVTQEIMEINETERKCKLHNDQESHKNPSVEVIYNAAGIRKKRILKTFSDNRLTRIESGEYDIDIEKPPKRDDSPFERIKHALTRNQKEKNFKNKSGEKGGLTKKRRQSFLQKVFKLKDEVSFNYETEYNSQLYDNNDHIDKNDTVISVDKSNSDYNYNDEDDKCNENEKRREKEDESKENKQNLEDYEKIESKENKQNAEDYEKIENNNERISGSSVVLYAEVKKNLAGSRTILPDPTMAELKMKLKSRESLEKQDFENENTERFANNNDKTTAPSLPPRRVVRPVSPWHDVPSNNAPIDSEKLFYAHQSTVKFKDTIPNQDLEASSNIVNYNEDNPENIKSSSVDSLKENFIKPDDLNLIGKNKSDDLSALLEQLTKITVAPLAEPECSDDNRSSSPESDKYYTKRSNFDPDYDIPRPHRPLSISINHENHVMASNELITRFKDDKNFSFHSIEPDSLEAEEKKFFT